MPLEVTFHDIDSGKIFRNLLKINSNVKTGWLSAQKRAVSTEISARNSPMLVCNIPGIKRKSTSTLGVGEENNAERECATSRVSESFA